MKESKSKIKPRCAGCGESRFAPTLHRLKCKDGVVRGFCAFCVVKLETLWRDDPGMLALVTKTPRQSARTVRFAGDFSTTPAWIKTPAIERKRGRHD
jgi:hypothetical protein